jgi:hypothetical protein
MVPDRVGSSSETELSEAWRGQRILTRGTTVGARARIIIAVAAGESSIPCESRSIC